MKLEVPVLKIINLSLELSVVISPVIKSVPDIYVIG